MITRLRDVCLHPTDSSLMRRGLMLLLAWLSMGYLQSAIVINEVCYDPAGADEGKEWLELYNNGTANVQLDGAKILAGGTTFTMQYTLPTFVLRPGRYLLIGESLVPNTQMVAELNLQNGTDATDGVRYLSPDGDYTDTVLYDAPNANQLPDDLCNIATSVALPATNGRSLARIRNGQDSNLCAQDFINEEQPTPGLANRLHADYALGSHSFTYQSGLASLSIYIKNRGPVVPLASAEFDVIQDDASLYHEWILPVAINDSILVQADFACAAAPLLIRIALADDPDSTNNSLTINPDGEETGVALINEFMADPAINDQEWVELKVGGISTPARTTRTTEYSIRDASNGHIRFTLPDTEGFYVVCSDTLLLRQRYPDCPTAAIIKASNWTNLNNDGDTLVLYAGDVALDSLAYTEADIAKGISRERFTDETEQVSWRNCCDAAGGTPGLANSLPPQVEYPDPGHVSISGSPFNPLGGQQLSISYAFDGDNNRISCKVFDLRGIKIATLADYDVSNSQGVITWNGRKQDGSYAPRGLYIILWEAQPGGTGKVHRQQLTAVIKS